MTKFNLKKIIIFVILFTLVVTNILTLLKIYNYEYSYGYYFGDESKRIFQKLNNGLNNFTSEGDLVLIYRHMITNGKGDYLSYIIGVTKDKQLYVTYGHQPMYLRLYGEKPKQMKPNFSVKKRLSRKEYLYITEQVENACYEYENKSVESFLEKYPTDWITENQVLYNGKCYSYDPQILYEDNFFYKNYTENDEEFQPLNLPFISSLNESMVKLENEILQGTDTE